MKLFKMPFRFWEDDHTALLRRTRGDKWADNREYYCRKHFHGLRDDGGPYFLNKRCRSLYDLQGPFKDRYKSGEVLVSKVQRDDPCFIICPGPSLDVDLVKDKFDGKKDFVSIAVNSAGYLFKPTYWCIAESGYARWMLGEGYRGWHQLVGTSVLATARVAVIIRDLELKLRKRIVKECFVIRWEEEFVVPPRTPAVTITNALVSAWEMGFKTVYVLGLDLSKKGGPYVKGVPFTNEGARNPFRDQIIALKQFELPDFSVYNCSPLSKDVLKNFKFCGIDSIP